MSWTALSNGYNIIEHQILNGVDKPIYPFTRSANVEVAADVAAGMELQSAQDAFATLFDRTKYATAAKAGIVKVTNVLAADGESDLVAASIGALKTLDDAVMKTASYSFGVYDGTKLQSLAILGSDGKVTSAQLPSYVDDVVDFYIVNSTTAFDDTKAVVTGYLDGGTFYEDAEHTSAITPAEGKIYVDKTSGEDDAAYEWDGSAFQTSTATPITGEASKIYVDLNTLNTYRWSGTVFVLISESLALGRTSSTAFPGDAGAALETFVAQAYQVEFYNTGSTAPTFSSGKGLAFEIMSTDS